MDFHKKKKVNRLIYSKTAIILLVGILAIIVHGTWGVVRKELVSRSDLVAARKALDSAKEKNKELEQSVAFLSTERGKEEVLRDKFGVSKAGEEVIVVLESDEPQNQENLPKIGIFERIKGFFSNIFGN